MTQLLVLATESGSGGGGSSLSISPLIWGVFLTVVLVLLLLDLLVFHRDAHAVSTSEAAWASAFWVGLGLAFAPVVWVWLGPEHGTNYLTGYLIEKSLSVDNLFVFVLIFSYFGVPNKYQHRVLFWGIFGAFIFRGIFIALGAALLSRFSWIAFIFGAFLIYTAWQLAHHEGVDVHPEENPVLNWARRLMPITKDFHGQNIFVKASEVDESEIGGGRSPKLGYVATPLFAVLIVIETTDIIFAVDSIPAIFAVTREPFIVFSSNALALLGLRALYFLLADLVARFRYLDVGLAAILGIVGVKLIYEELVHMSDQGTITLPEWAVYHIEPWMPLILVAIILTIAIVASIKNPPEDAELEERLQEAEKAESPTERS